MQLAIQISQIVISTILIGLILIQNKGIGLSSTFGGGGEVYYTRRGAEKAVFILTIIISTLFVINATLNVWLN
ncbi:preprotein translocase subunit SecG [candidate division WWE3 bacterium]|nr:preprotein translocase subunit SecG [candidate division WWE3 bacterium]